MLVPLLALPVRDPLWNLLAQRFLLILAGLSVPVLVARHVLGGRDWVLAGLLAAAGLLFFWPARWSFDFLGSQPYGLSIAATLAGLALAEPGGRWGPRWLRGTAGAAVVLAGHWVNAAAGLVLLPLAVVRAWLDWWEGGDARRVRRRLLVDGGLLVGGLAAGQLLLKVQPPAGDYVGWSYSQTLPPAQWAHAVAEFAKNVWWAADTWPLWMAGCAVAGTLLLSTGPLRPFLKGALLRALALVVAALSYAAVVSVLRWVSENAWHPRYFAPSAALLLVAALGLLAEPLARAPGLARPAGLGAVFLVPLAAVASWGMPSLGGVRADLDRVAGRRTAAVLAARCDLIAGDYWTVWPSVWHANATLAERGEPRPVWGIAHRCRPTAPQWQARPREGLRICVAHGEDRAAAHWIDRCGLGPARVAERGEAVDVWVPLPPERPATSRRGKGP